MSAREPEQPAGADASPEAQEGVRCDFCGERVPSVRRIALDHEYERLRTKHRERYACPTCSEKKDSERARS